MTNFSSNLQINTFNRVFFVFATAHPKLFDHGESDFTSLQNPLLGVSVSIAAI